MTRTISIAAFRPQSTKGLAYPTIGFLMSGLWYGALLLVPWTRSVLWPSELSDQYMYTRFMNPTVSLLFMCITSVSIALLFKRRIIMAGPVGKSLNGLLFPFLGAVLFSWLVMAWIVFTELRSLPELTIGLFFPLNAVFHALLAFPVVIPLGYLSQFVMQNVDRTQEE